MGKDILNKTILCIAIEFFPFNSTGSFRYTKFLKHLKFEGFNIIVIVPTITDRKVLLPNALLEQKMFEEILNYCTIVEIPFGETKKNFMFHRIKNLFRFVGINTNKWKESIELYIKKYLETKQINFIYSTVPPFEVGVMACEIANKFNIKFIADIRDPWVFNRSIPFPSYFHYKNIYNLEKKILEGANKVIVVTPELLNLLSKKYEKIDSSKFCLITNGFDSLSTVFDKIIELNLVSNKLNIAYSGALYYNPILDDLIKPFYKRKGNRIVGYRPTFTNENWSYASPLFFLKTLKLVFEKKSSLKNRICFHFIGREPKWLRDMIIENDLENNFISHGFVKKSKNLEILSECSALLLFSEKVFGGKGYSITSKIFDYILLNKIIFAFVPEGDTKDILVEANNSILFNPDEIEINANKIIDLFDKVTTLKVNTESFHKYKSENLSKKLINILND